MIVVPTYNSASFVRNPPADSCTYQLHPSRMVDISGLAEVVESRFNAVTRSRGQELMPGVIFISGRRLQAIFAVWCSLLFSVEYTHGVRYTVHVDECNASQHVTRADCRSPLLPRRFSCCRCVAWREGHGTHTHSLTQSVPWSPGADLVVLVVQ